MKRRDFFKVAVGAALVPFAVEAVREPNTGTYNMEPAQERFFKSNEQLDVEVFDTITLNKGTYYVSAETGNFDTFESDGTNMIELGKGLERNGKPNEIRIWRLS